MTDKTLKSSDFATEKTQVFDCGLDNRDPQRGYRRAYYLSDKLEFLRIFEGKFEKNVPAQDLSKER